MSKKLTREDMATKVIDLLAELDDETVEMIFNNIELFNKNAKDLKNTGEETGFYMNRLKNTTEDLGDSTDRQTTKIYELTDSINSLKRILEQIDLNNINKFIQKVDDLDYTVRLIQNIQNKL